MKVSFASRIWTLRERVGALLHESPRRNTHWKHSSPEWKGEGEQRLGHLPKITTFRVLFGKKSQSPGNTGDKHSWGVHLQPLPSSNCHGPEVELCPISPSTNERPQKLGIWNRHVNPKRQLKIIMRNDRIWCILLWTNNMAMHTGSPIQRGVFFIDISSLTRNNHFPMSHVPRPMSWQRSHRRIGVALASRFGDLYIIFIHSANGSLVTIVLVVYYVRCFSRNPGCEGQNQVSSTSCTKSIELLLRPWKSSPPKEKWGSPVEKIFYHHHLFFQGFMISCFISPWLD